MGTRKQKLAAEPVAATPITEALPPLRLEWRTPQELADNPRNWKKHPENQTQALASVLADVGWAGALLYNEHPDCQRLVDGHARNKLALKQGADRVPVLIGRWTPQQEALILATLDPLAALAVPEAGALADLLKDVQTEDAAVEQMLADLLHKATQSVEVPDEPEPPAPAGDESQLLLEKFQILIDCRDEAEQAALLERLTAEGLLCKSLIV